MNIFVLAVCVSEIAKSMPDKHVVKMILEYTQLLCSAHRILDGNENADKLGLYKSTHRNHPCTIWTRKCDANYKWLHSLLGNVFNEYTYRYDKTHSSYRLYEILSTPPYNIPISNSITPFALAMPDQYKPSNTPKTANIFDTINSYRRYLIGDKQRLASWKRRDPPYWWKIV